MVYLLLKCIEQKQQKIAKLTSSYPHTTNNFQPQNLFFSVKIIVKHTDEQFKVQNQRRREKRWGEKMLTSLERRLPWLGNTNCIVVSREKKISGLVYLYYISSLYLLESTQWNKNKDYVFAIFFREIIAIRYTQFCCTYDFKTF